MVQILVSFHIHVGNVGLEQENNDGESGGCGN